MFCSHCGADNDDSYKFCEKCGKSLTSQALVDERMRGSRSVTVKTYADGKVTWAAVLLSFLVCGGGQLYNGDFKKGLVMFGGAVVLAFVTAGVGTLFVWVWGMIDASQGSKRTWPIW